MLKANTPYVIISVVTPQTDDPTTSGRVINFPCAPTVSHDMVEFTEGQYLVPAAYSRRGYVREIDLLADETGVDPECGLTGPEKLAKHLEYHQRAQAGHRVGNYPKEWLSIECRRRQAVGEPDTKQALADANRTAPVTARLAKGGKAVTE